MSAGCVLRAKSSLLESVVRARSSEGNVLLYVGTGEKKPPLLENGISATKSLRVGFAWPCRLLLEALNVGLILIIFAWFRQDVFRQIGTAKHCAGTFSGQPWASTPSAKPEVILSVPKRRQIKNCMRKMAKDTQGYARQKVPALLITTPAYANRLAVWISMPPFGRLRCRAFRRMASGRGYRDPTYLPALNRTAGHGSKFFSKRGILISNQSRISF